jgi:hypothetical protein
VRAAGEVSWSERLHKGQQVEVRLVRAAIVSSHRKM